MEKKVNLKGVYVPSENVVAREVAGEFIIVPIASGIGDSEDELFSLNETGKAIWDKLYGKRSLRDVVKDLSVDFEGSLEVIERDVVGLVEELFKRKMLVEIKKG